MFISCLVKRMSISWVRHVAMLFALEFDVCQLPKVHQLLLDPRILRPEQARRPGLLLNRDHYYYLSRNKIIKNAFLLFFPSQSNNPQEIFEMGSSCTARQPLSKPEDELHLPQNTAKTPRMNTSGTSDFLPRMNALLSRTGYESKVGLGSRYVEQKVLDEDATLKSGHLEIFTALLRTQFKGSLFLDHNEIRSDTSIRNDQENVKEIAQKLSEYQAREVSAILNTHFLFLQLSSVQKTQAVKQMRKFEAEQNAFIFKEGDNAERFFIICEGEVEIIIDGDSKKTLGKHQSFGEIALLYGTKRTASVRALTRCVLWGIDGASFKRVVSEINLKTEKENREFLEKTSFFNYLTPIQQQSVMNVILTLEYKSGEIIINEKTNANSFYIIKSGEVIIQSKDGGDVEMNINHQFGEESFDSFRKSRQVTQVKAKTNCTIICIAKEQISEALGSSIEEVILKNKIKRIIERSKRFRVIYHKNIDYYVEEFSVRTMTQGQKIMKKGHVMKYLYVPLDVDMSSTDKRYQKEQIIEENLLLEGKPLNHGIKADCSGSILLIKPRNHIFNQIKNFHSAIDPAQLRLDNIQIIKKIGSGQFGEVYAGIHLLSNSLVAIKSVSKKIVDKYKIDRQIINEHISMNRINHPFIIKYYKTFVSDLNIHFVIEYIEGMEFFDVIRKIGLLKSSQAQFYVAQIMVALEYLHNHNIIYRDLKPENIMVEKNGYLRLIDMGTAKVLDKDNYYKTRTVIGTPHYMAPETISGKGYGFLSDLWSLGIVLYELVCGYFPYQEKHNDPFQIYKLIMNKPLQFPGYLKDMEVKEMILKLLNKSPEMRMSKGYDQLKRMNFFKDLDWKALENKTLPPVYNIPDVVGVNINEIQRESLETMQEYFEKRSVKNNTVGLSTRFLAWEKDLMDGQ